MAIKKDDAKDLLFLCEKIVSTYIDQGFEGVEVTATYKVSTETNIDYDEVVIVPEVTIKVGERLWIPPTK